MHERTLKQAEDTVKSLANFGLCGDQGKSKRGWILQNAVKPYMCTESTGFIAAWGESAHRGHAHRRQLYNDVYARWLPHVSWLLWTCWLCASSRINGTLLSPNEHGRFHFTRVTSLSPPPAAALVGTYVKCRCLRLSPFRSHFGAKSKVVLTKTKFRYRPGTDYVLALTSPPGGDGV